MELAKIELRELTTKEEMLLNLDVMKELYPALSLEKYNRMLTKMLPKDYFQLGAFENGICLGISGYWLGTKMWCDDYIELDNIVVSEKARSKGVGKLLFDYLEQKAKTRGCSMLSLDSYVANVEAHRLFHKLGFDSKGVHFVKVLDKNKLT